jgi:hypothetical protein
LAEVGDELLQVLVRLTLRRPFPAAPPERRRHVVKKGWPRIVARSGLATFLLVVTAIRALMAAWQPGLPDRRTAR